MQTAGREGSLLPPRRGNSVTPMSGWYRWAVRQHTANPVTERLKKTKSSDGYLQGAHRYVCRLVRDPSLSLDRQGSVS